MPDQSAVMQVILPPGKAPGDTMVVGRPLAHGGGSFTFVVPAGALPGKPFAVAFPSPPEPPRRRWPWLLAAAVAALAAVSMVPRDPPLYSVRLPDRGDRAALAALTRLVRSQHGAGGAPFVLREFGAPDAVLSGGWGALEAHCDVPIPTDPNGRPYLVDATGSAGAAEWAGIRYLEPGELHREGSPRTVAQLSERVRRRRAPSVAPKLAIFDFPLPSACPKYAELLTKELAEEVSDVFAIDAGRRFRRLEDSPRLFVHPRGAISTAHVDGGGSYFWLRVLRGEKLVRLPAPAAAWGGLLAGGAGLEFTLRSGDLFFGPVGLRHEVLTVEPSISISANYFPRGQAAGRGGEKKAAAAADPLSFAVEGLSIREWSAEPAAAAAGEARQGRAYSGVASGQPTRSKITFAHRFWSTLAVVALAMLYAKFVKAPAAAVD